MAKRHSDHDPNEMVPVKITWRPRQELNVIAELKGVSLQDYLGQAIEASIHSKTRALMDRMRRSLDEDEVEEKGSE